jgi:hypothetical protein
MDTIYNSKQLKADGFVVLTGSNNVAGIMSGGANGIEF